ncbi:MAG TPA: hypothetical protein VIH28_10140 [Ignavibacteriaceae bacterium]
MNKSIFDYDVKSLFRDGKYVIHKDKKSDVWYLTFGNTVIYEGTSAEVKKQFNTEINKKLEKE